MLYLRQNGFAPDAAYYVLLAFPKHMKIEGQIGNAVASDILSL